MEIEARLTINSPVDVVFDVLADVEHRSQWMESVVACELTSDSAVSEGSSFKETNQVTGRKVTQTHKIIKYVPGKIFATQTSDAPLPHTLTYTLTDSGSSTAIATRLTSERSGAGQGPSAALTEAVLEKQLKDNLRALKRLIEERHQPE